MKTVGVGMIGCGVVGCGVWRHLERNGALMSDRTGIRLEIRKIAVREAQKDRGIPQKFFTSDWREVVNDPQVNLVLELMGGATTAREAAEAALRAGKPLITANKALLAEHGESLCALADKQGAPLYFEASVAGGIPIIKALREGLCANRIRSIHGIINGTCNYILTRMAEHGESFEAALAEAKRLGYAEADERLDVDGWDAAHKAAILASLAYGFWIPASRAHVEGIRGVEPLDVKLARKFGYALKLLAIIRADENNAVNIRVHPTLVPSQHILASVNGAYNAIAVDGDVVGDTLFYGKGAGADATASAVLSDLIEAGINWSAQKKPSPLSGHCLDGKIVGMEKIRARYYMRLTVVDRPGVLAQVASILGLQQISISSVFQPERHEGKAVSLVLLLHEAHEAVIQAAVRQINQLEATQEKTRIIRIEDFS
ncbi:MAG: homoserine dehydrogenase [bacterium]